METILGDFRYAFRMLLKNPGSTLVAIFALTVGIGANTAVFSVLNGVLLQPVKYHSPERLVVIWEANPAKGIHEFYVSPPDFRDFVEQNRSFETLAAFRPHPSILTGGSLPERLESASVSASIFELLGAHTAIGRYFARDEDQPARNRVVVLSHGLWLRRFGGDRTIIGKTIVLDGGPHTVTGVMSPEFRLLDAASELWIPYTLDSKELKERGFHTIKVIGRLKAGVSFDQGRQEMQGIARNLERQFPDTNAGWTVEPVMLRDQLVGNIEPTLLALSGAVGFVLLIACSNVAILLLTRASGRHKEIAIRAALGASHYRIIRQVLSESLLLSLISGILGLLLAYLGIAALIALKPVNLPRMEEITIDWRMALFTLGMSVLTALLFGMFPAATSIRVRINEVLRVAGRSAMSGAQARHTRGVLVVTEIALSVVLLVGAGVMIRSFLQLQAVDPGFRAERVLTMEVALPESRYHGFEVARFYQKLLDRIQQLPGVISASVARNVPLSGGDPSLNFVVENRPEVASADQSRAKYRAISSAYFSSMGVPLIKGRFFTDSDRENSQGVAIVNETLARRFFPSEDPVGRRMKPGFDDSVWSTIVGVVGNVKHAGLDAETNAEMYYPYLQVPAEMMNFVEGSMTIVVRSQGDPTALTSAIRAAVLVIDPQQPVFHVKTMQQLLNGSIAQPRLRAILLGVFAAVALALAVVGLYGVVSYSVSQRSNEMGVRAALGAGRGDLMRLVLGEGARLAATGVLIGVASSFLVTRALSKLLFGVKPGDPVTFTLIPLILLVAALLACYFPALRASRTDPSIAMR